MGWSHYKEGGGPYHDSTIDPAELEQALLYFERSGTLNPFNSDAHNYQGNTLTHLMRYEEALHRFDRTLRFRPKDLTARYGKAYALMKLSRYPEMVDELRRCFAIEPDLDSRVRFSEHFAHLRDHPEMSGFRAYIRVDE